MRGPGNKRRVTGNHSIKIEWKVIAEPELRENMQMDDLTERLWELDSSETPVQIYEGHDATRIVVKKGEKTDKYDDRDIQIQLTGENWAEEYPPKHALVFQDLDEEITADEALAAELYDFISRTFENEDPDKYVDELRSMEFDAGDLTPDVLVYLVQVMMVEQEINFGPAGNSNYHPPRDLLMGCIRRIFADDYTDIKDVIDDAYKGVVPSYHEYDGDDIWARPEM